MTQNTSMNFKLLIEEENSPFARSTESEFSVNAEKTSIWMRRILSFVKNNLGEDLSLDDMAEAAGMSRYALCRTFRVRHSVSPMKWLGQLRVQTARRIILESPHIPLADVAAFCGFSSPSHLSRAFKQLYGIAPSEMRRIESSLAKSDVENFALAG